LCLHSVAVATIVIVVIPVTHQNKMTIETRLLFSLSLLLLVILHVSNQSEIQLLDNSYSIRELRRRHKGMNFEEFADENGQVQVFATFRSKIRPSDWRLVPPGGEYVPKHTITFLTNTSYARELLTHPRIRHVSVLPHTHKYDPKLLSLDLDSQELLADMAGMIPIIQSKDINMESKKTEALDFLLFPTPDVHKLVRKWEAETRERFSFLNDIQLKVSSDRKVRAEFKFPSLQSRIENRGKLIDWLARKHHVRHVQLSEDFYIESDLTTGQFIEEYVSNAKSLKYQNLLESEYRDLGVHSLVDVQLFWKWNITGKGHVVGVGDTGIDIDHCMFKDSKVPQPKYTTYKERETIPLMNEKTMSDTINHGHRKIVEYWAQADKVDLPGGHGSHVAGILAGSLEGSDNKNLYTGILPDAKLAFIDLGLPDKTLKLPEDLAETYFPFMAKTGASIFSNSWGNRNYGAYSLSAREIDYFMWKNPYTLAVFAAGNSGREGSKTITAPSTAKNCLTVGSSEASSKNFKLGIPLYSDLMRGNVPCNKDSFIFISPDFCGSRPTPCNDPETVAQTCDALKSENASAEEICCRVPFLQRICCSQYLLSNNLQELNPKSREYSDKNVAVFSSRGPTRDGRIKPEILTIGQPIFSARAHGKLYKGKQCPIPQVMQGTSQSTPLVAGYCVMVKEYMQTLYSKFNNVNGAADIQSKQLKDYEQGKVMGSLIKAIIINSGNELKGVVDINGKGVIKELVGFPSFTQGFGNLNLSTIMPFPGSNKFLFATQDSIQTNVQKKYCFQTPKGQVKKITLVWTDYPASPSAQFTLVNNLDLAVVLPNGKVKMGNNADSGYGDEINVVEQVILDRPETHIQIIVKGVNVPHGPQPYSLVVSGEGKTKVLQC